MISSRTDHGRDRSRYIKVERRGRDPHAAAVIALRRIAAIAAVVLMLPGAAADELAGGPPGRRDPLLEQRVDRIASVLRCLVCQNQTIADSHAELAIDLKNQIREQLGRGGTESSVIDYMVARYGDFVLYRPPLRTHTIPLWFGPAGFALVAAVVVALVLRRRSIDDSRPAALDADERQRLARLMASDGIQAERR